ncbi:DUF1634 domain-containing protein [Mucilaginibacter myungsuensis]|uniref:DUF1634 domain-containing protein n=1 Tax=Mucilaginibacter myungsuensis TaxID=649104 RepID=A0A929PZG9_9SPHI|nr:DUF1634 domain-containing protein [Mucilaginibacter myungsuensis]MBE9664402.1 DUF1634 domain-containing protein [Mucilaginibacter myungsuensis]MDN3597113.1 DUF1634 domain-containing protein [Mucilaginibacter myungsuensis]
MAAGNFKDKDMQSIIGWILRVGVIVSMTVVVFGGAVYLYRHGHSIPDYSAFNGVPQFVYPSNIISGILAFRGRAIIQAGIILLISTPVLRIIFSFIGFIIEKDRLYTFISLLVLLIIVASMLSGHAG